MTPHTTERRTSKNWSPRLYIVGIVGLLLVPLILTAVSVWRGAEAAEARVRSERLARAQLTAQTLSSFVDARLATVQALARTPDIRDLGNRPDLQGFLDQALADSPDWLGIEVFEPDGSSIIGAGPGVQQQSIGNRAYFQEALATNTPVIGPAIALQNSRAPAVPLVAPVEFVTGARGALIAWLSTDRLDDALAAAEGEDGIESAVIDGQGSIFARSGGGRSPAIVPVAQEWGGAPLLGGETSVTEIDRAGAPAMLVAVAPVPAAPWTVVVSQPSAAAFSDIRDELRNQLILIGITAVVISVLAYHLVSRLSRAYHRQIEAVGRVDAFVAAASHDLKTPLTAIKALAQLLQRRTSRSNSQDAPWLSDGLAEIDVATNRMTRQINELLDAARFQRGAVLELQRRPTDIVALSRRVAAEQQKTTDHHRIQVNAIADSITGPWDEERLERVVANLVGNAIKYSPTGGDITVQVCREAQPSANGSHESRKALEWAVVTVEDHGMGIPIRDLPYIFERYHRGGNVAEIISGTGIGLAGAKQIVEQHGGAISVVSSEGDGAIFTVRLPMTIVDNAAKN